MLKTSSAPFIKYIFYIRIYDEYNIKFIYTKFSDQRKCIFSWLVSLVYFIRYNRIVKKRVYRGRIYIFLGIIKFSYDDVILLYLVLI